MLENFKEEQLIFYVAIPGSGWSKLSLLLSCCKKLNLNNTDRSVERQECGKNGVPEIIHHKGAYWDPMMEFGNGFDDIGKNYTKQEFIEECLKPFQEHDDRNYLIRSHFFAETHNLNWLTENFPNNKIICVLRERQLSLEGWYSGMTFTGNYPQYKAWMEWEHRHDDDHPSHKKKLWSLIQRHDKMLRQWVLENDSRVYVINPNRRFLNDLDYSWDREGIEEYNKLMLIHQFYKCDYPHYDSPFVLYNCNDLW